MRFVKFVQFATGLAAAGGALVLLSSSALAATSDSVTAPQSTNNLPPIQSNQSQNVPPVTAQSDVAPTNDHTGTITQNSNTDQDKTQGNTTNPTVTSGPSQTSGTPQASQGSGSGSTTGGGTQPAATSAPVSGQTVAPTTGNGPTVASDNNAGSQAAQQQSPLVPNATSNTPATTVNPTSISVPVIFYQSRALAVQTLIVNHESDPSDLASTIPSAPVPAKAPAPAKSNGALGQLTAELAGVTVPQPFFPNVIPADHAKLALSLVTLVVLLGNLVVLTYGLWLRRGGFATAARSDSPVTGFTSPFATPLLMGYASAPPRSHSPSLMVSDYKIRKILFPTLAERRRNI